MRIAASSGRISLSARAYVLRQRICERLTGHRFMPYSASVSTLTEECSVCHRIRMSVRQIT